MNEISTSFGPGRYLVGTLTLPEPLQPPALGCVLLNAGVIHRIGPRRLNVKLARELAAAGVPSLRFDLAGLGDSNVPRDAMPYEQQAVIDIRRAIDHLQRTAGVKRCVVAGICSGAVQALATAQQDDRVAGVWMLDGYSYPTRKTRWINWRRRLNRVLHPHVPSLLLGKLKAMLGRIAAAESEEDAARRNDRMRAIPSPASYAAALQSLVDRGVEVFVMYSGSLLAEYNYAEQFRDRFGAHRFVDAVRCEFAPHIDHSVTELAAQRHVISTICAWAGAVAANGRDAARA